MRTGTANTAIKNSFRNYFVRFAKNSGLIKFLGVPLNQTLKNLTMDMRKWIQHPFRSDSQPMSSSQDKLQLQKTSVLDRVDNNETVVAPDDLGEDRPKQVRLQKYRAAFFG